MSPLVLFKEFLEYSGKGMAGLNALLTVIGPGIIKLEPDLRQIVVDIQKFASDFAALFATGSASVATAIANAGTKPAA